MENMQLTLKNMTNNMKDERNFFAMNPNHKYSINIEHSFIKNIHSPTNFFEIKKDINDEEISLSLMSIQTESLEHNFKNIVKILNKNSNN